MNENKPGTTSNVPPTPPTIIVDSRYIVVGLIVCGIILSTVWLLNGMWNRAAASTDKLGPTATAASVETDDIQILRNMVADQQRQIGLLRKNTEDLDRQLAEQVGKIIIEIEALKKLSDPNKEIATADRIKTAEDRIKVMEGALVKLVEKWESLKKAQKPQETIVEVPAPQWRP